MIVSFIVASVLRDIISEAISFLFAGFDICSLITT